MPEYDEKLDLVRKYQEAFVTKMLSYSLNYNHVLYCIDNETTTPKEWGQHWIKFIEAKASIKTARLVESEIKFWEVEPKMQLLSDREPNEAYLAAETGEKYILYFPYGAVWTLIFPVQKTGFG